MLRSAARREDVSESADPFHAGHALIGLRTTAMSEIILKPRQIFEGLAAREDFRIA